MSTLVPPIIGDGGVQSPPVLPTDFPRRVSEGSLLDPVLEIGNTTQPSGPFRSPRSKNAPSSLWSPKTSPLSKTAPETALTETNKVSPLAKASPAYDYDSPSPSGEIRSRTGSLSKRRRSAQLLEPLVINPSTWRTISINANKDEDERDVRTAQEGMNILASFLEVELKKEGFDAIDIHESITTLSIKTPATVSSTLLETLNDLILKFDLTPQRHMIMFRASRIDVESITSTEFENSLTELFADNTIDLERFLVMLFFCKDVCAKALSEGKKTDYMNFVDWTATFIKNRLSILVFKRGGWSNVVFDGRGFKNIGYGLLTAGMIVGFCFLVTHGKKHLLGT